MQHCKNFITTTIKVVGIIVLALLLIINILQISQVINLAENVKISFVSIKYHIATIITILLILLLIFLNTKYKLINFKNRKWIVISLIIYAIICYKWINYSGAAPIDDSLSVYETAQNIVLKGIDFLKNNSYLEKCPQQISMAFFFALIFQIFSTTDYIVIQLLNIVANIFIILGIYNLTILLTKKDSQESITSFFITLTFFPLIILSNFVYGDYIGLAFVIWSIIFLFKYNKEKKIIHFILSSLLLMLALMIKMNYLIILIAYGIYFIIKLLKQFEKSKKYLIKIGLLILFLSINLVPYIAVKQWATNKFNLDPKQSLPTTGYLYMGMSESYREAGWYGETIVPAWENAKKSRKEYPKLIKKRFNKFIDKPLYFLDFYRRKITSGWADPTFQSVWYGIKYENKDAQLQKIYSSSKYKVMIIYLRALSIIIFGFALYALWSNKKKISEENLLLVVIFLGGFFFHILWEMKSRYTMPYLIILIPLASIGVSHFLNMLNIKWQEKRTSKIETKEKEG